MVLPYLFPCLALWDLEIERERGKGQQRIAKLIINILSILPPAEQQPANPPPKPPRLRSATSPKPEILAVTLTSFPSLSFPIPPLSRHYFPLRQGAEACFPRHGGGGGDLNLLAACLTSRERHAGRGS